VVDSSFEAALKQRLDEARSRYEAGNFDDLRSPAPVSKRFQRLAADVVSLLLNSLPIVPRCDGRDTSDLFATIEKDKDKWQQAYELLADNYSRRLFVDLQAYRILGARHVKLPTNNAGYWKKRRLLKKYYRGKTHLPGPGMGTFVIPIDGESVRISCHALHVLNTFILEQYSCARLSPKACVQKGDVVIDGGGCWGDSAVYFAVKAGEFGRIYSFEFDEANVSLFRTNLAANPNLAGRIQIVSRGLWSASGERITWASNGPSSHLNEKGTGPLTSTISIDNFVEEAGLDRLNFIKLDIEGAEYPTLVGAEISLRRFTPKLAISVYHAPEDLHRIVSHLNDLQLGYVFALDHFTIHGEETVLFAVVPK